MTQIVHHIDGNAENNALENIMIMDAKARQAHDPLAIAEERIRARENALRLTDAERIRKRCFEQRMAPLTANVTASIINTFTPGVNWRGCTKGDMARAFAKGERYLHTVSEENLIAGIRRYLEMHYSI